MWLSVFTVHMLIQFIFSKSCFMWIKFSGSVWGFEGRAFLDTSVDVDIKEIFICCFRFIPNARSSL